MEPYISPWFFYWANVVNGLRGLCFGLSVFLIIMFIVVLSITEGDIVSNRIMGPREMKAFKLWLASAFFAAFFILCGIFIPTRDTLLQMTVANFVTPKNVETGVDTVKHVIDYIVEAIASMSK